MNRRTKDWLMAAVSLILMGSVLFVGVMSKMNWDLSNDRYETHTYSVTEAFTHVFVDVKTADVTFAPSTDGTVSVVCDRDIRVKHTVSVEDSTLIVREEDTREWYHHLYVFSASAKITVYLPAATYGDLAVHTTTGDVAIPDGYTFATADMRVTTGDIACASDVVGALNVKTTTGDVKLSSVTCGDLTVKVTTGDVSFDACDAASLTVKTTTGDITGTLLTPKVFDAHATTGRVEVPQTTTGGHCTLRATTGDIRIRLL